MSINAFVAIDNPPCDRRTSTIGRTIVPSAYSTIEIRLSGGVKEQIHCPMGYVKSGMCVLVHNDKGSYRFIGAISSCEVPSKPEVARYIQSGFPFVTRVLQRNSQSFSIAVNPLGGRIGLISHPSQDLRVGDRVAAVMVDFGPKVRWPRASPQDCRRCPLWKALRDGSYEPSLSKSGP